MGLAGFWLLSETDSFRVVGQFDYGGLEFIPLGCRFRGHELKFDEL